MADRSITAALAALRADEDERSGWVKPSLNNLQWDREGYIAGFGWIRADGAWVSRSDDTGRHAFRPEWVDRWRMRRAVRAWARRRVCHVEGHAPALYERTGTRRSDSWAYVAERVTQPARRCRRCGDGLDWIDVEGSVRGFTSYSAPAALHDRVMYGGGDWSAPREVTP
jgi:hypothetical protein